MKKMLFLAIITVLLAGCSAGQASLPQPAPSAVTSSPQPSKAATPLPPTATIQPLDTPVQQATSATPVATQTIEYKPLPVVEPKFDTTAPGKYIPLTKDGGIQYRFRVNIAFTGQEAAKKLAKYQLPAELQWVIVLVDMEYLKGPANHRAQLMDENNFHIISRGHVLANDYLTYGPVSNHLNQILLMPGEASTGYLVYAISKDDNRPVLRYDEQGVSHFFDLFPSAPASNPPAQETPILFGMGGLGMPDAPVALGKRVAYQWKDATLFLSVKNVVAGFSADRRLWEIASSNPSPGAGQMLIMPYLEITSAQASQEPIEIDDSLFTIFSSGETLPIPELSCPYPCLADITLYQGGQAQGWLPRLAAQNDRAPLLRFNNELYFALTEPADQNTGRVEMVPPVFPADAIGKNTIKQVGLVGEVRQQSPLQALAFSPDNRLLASGGDDRKIHIWDVAQTSEITTLAKHQAAVMDLSFSGDGKLLVSVSSDEDVIVWKVSEWSVLQQLKQPGRGIFGEFLPDNRLVTANQNGLVTIWNPETGEFLQKYSTQKNIAPGCEGSLLYSFDMTPDGKIFAAALACGYGVMWEPGSQTRLATVFNHANDRGGTLPYIAAISLSPINGLAAYGGSYYHDVNGFLVDVVDMAKNLVLGGVGTGTNNIPAIAFAPNGELIAAAIGSQVRTWWPDGYVWDGHHSIDLEAHRAQVTALEFARDASLLASGDYSGRIILWKVVN